MVKRKPTGKNFWIGLLKSLGLIAAGLAYLTWTFDFIPDGAVPVIGYLDDAMLLMAAAWFIRDDIKEILKWSKKVI